MNAIPCTPRHEKQDDTFASWENLPAGVMASLSQRTVRLDWCSSWWCHCRWCTQMGQRASEAGSEEKDDWQGQDAERQLSGWHWQTAGEEIAKKFCGRNYALNFTALQGCNMSTWRWTWGRNLSVNEGWQDSPPESFSSDLSSTKNLAPWSTTDESVSEALFCCHKDDSWILSTERQNIQLNRTGQINKVIVDI